MNTALKNNNFYMIFTMTQYQNVKKNKRTWKELFQKKKKYDSLCIMLRTVFKSLMEYRMFSNLIHTQVLAIS
jgi:hypothetical protein